MAISPPHACGHVGCSALTTTRYCPVHAADATLGKFSDVRRGSRQSRGYGSGWDKLRGMIIARDKGLCQVCARAGRLAAATQVDHIKGKASGGTDDAGNLQAICTACHRAKTALEAQVNR